MCVVVGCLPSPGPSWPFCLQWLQLWALGTNTQGCINQASLPGGSWVGLAKRDNLKEGHTSLTPTCTGMTQRTPWCSVSPGQQWLCCLSLGVSPSVLVPLALFTPCRQHLLFVCLFIEVFKFLCWGIFDLQRLSRWHSGKESACWFRRQEFSSWVGKIPWRRKW